MCFCINHKTGLPLKPLLHVYYYIKYRGSSQLALKIDFKRLRLTAQRYCQFTTLVTTQAAIITQTPILFISTKQSVI